MKKALVCGAGGFIGSHLVRRLKEQGYWVAGADLKTPEFSMSEADHFFLCDLRRQQDCRKIFEREYDEVYQLAADMGGAGYVFSGENDASIMSSSALININVLSEENRRSVGKFFYSSSACMYPSHNQEDAENPCCEESSAYPANPDSEYGWEKLFSERLYLAHHRNYGTEVRIARFHNIFGPEGTWCGGKEKAPAAICRKVAEAENRGFIEIWGDGEQTRSFLYVEECIDGILRLMEQEWVGPVNIGSEEMISINALVAMAMEIAGKSLFVKHVSGPQGVRGRNSDNRLIEKMLGWKPSASLRSGMEKTYRWILQEVNSKKQECMKSQ